MKLRIKEHKYLDESSYFIEVFAKFEKYGFWKKKQVEDWIPLYEYCGDKFFHLGLETKARWKPIIFKNIEEAQDFIKENSKEKDKVEYIIHNI